MLACTAAVILRLFLPLTLGAMVDIQYFVPPLILSCASLFHTAPCWRGWNLYGRLTCRYWAPLQAPPPILALKRGFTVGICLCFSFDEMAWDWPYMGLACVSSWTIDTVLLWMKIDKVEDIVVFPAYCKQMLAK